MLDLHVAVVSAGRSGNVPAMQALCGDLVPTWYVPEDQAGDYRYAGATEVVSSGGLVASRNAALDAADGRYCLQLSDDLKRLGWAHGTTRDSVEAMTMPVAVAAMRQALADTGAQLAGVAPTDNPYFAKARVHRSAFIVGDMVLTAPGCAERFDPELQLKEDYDYTLQHLTNHGVVARVDQLLASFAHRTNKGGAVAYRTPEAEQAAIAYLQAKWPGRIVPNTKRPNEVLLRWK